MDMIEELLSADSSPSITESMPYDEYAALPALRSGHIKDGVFRDVEHQIVISPLHIRASYNGLVQRDSDSMQFGRALHCILLEPNEFERRFAFFEGRRDERTQAYKDFLAESAGKEILKRWGPMSWEWCLQAAMSLCDTPAVTAFTKHGVAESVGVASIADVPVKARFDWLSSSEGCLCDIKTTRSVGPVDFWYEFKRYSYGIQLALYREVYRLVMDMTLPVVVIAVENHPPFASVAYSVPSDLLDRELSIVQAACGKVRHSLETGKWPSFASQVIGLAVPEYEMDEVSVVEWEEAE